MFLRCRCLLVWLALTASAAGVAGWAGTAAEPAVGSVVGPTARFDELVVAIAAISLVACAAWAWVVGSVVVVQALRRPGRPPTSTRGVPSWASRVVLAACGLALVATVPAQASYDVHHPPRHPPRAGQSVDGLPFPDRAVGPATAARAPQALRPAPAQASLAAASVVVRPGDSLWRIAERLLGADASAAEVATATRTLHDLNRAAIGPDPDLIHPGLRLRTPGS
ncbi:LysM peptidoglycan-binding domain-containing protein [Nocardioides plantarum]|uniref:LysM peptidoglycan-binding domain-containing protein n=1 Tax=Nocardioides plantarum TaxID=29299 RepID=A0ABV5KBE3_9ACTN|nr:LysM domain-containing protein [Nocardioides plantarum]